MANSTDGTLDVVPVKATAVASDGHGHRDRGRRRVRRRSARRYAFNDTSSINWFGPNQNLATTVISGLDGDRQITSPQRRRQYTHLVVDVTGYYR